LVSTVEQLKVLWRVACSRIIVKTTWGENIYFSKLFKNRFFNRFFSKPMFEIVFHFNLRKTVSAIFSQHKLSSFFLNINIFGHLFSELYKHFFSTNNWWIGNEFQIKSKFKVFFA
jgi:hypothetical protein